MSSDIIYGPIAMEDPQPHPTRDMITVTQFKREKQKFEDQFARMITEFQRRTGALIESVDIRWDDIRKMGYDPDDNELRFSLLDVNCGVRL